MMQSPGFVAERIVVENLLQAEAAAAQAKAVTAPVTSEVSILEV